MIYYRGFNESCSSQIDHTACDNTHMHAHIHFFKDREKNASVQFMLSLNFNYMKFKFKTLSFVIQAIKQLNNKLPSILSLADRDLCTELPFLPTMNKQKKRRHARSVRIHATQNTSQAKIIAE